jgi:hypothetical protein
MDQQLDIPGHPKTRVNAVCLSEMIASIINNTTLSLVDSNGRKYAFSCHTLVHISNYSIVFQTTCQGIGMFIKLEFQFVVSNEQFISQNLPHTSKIYESKEVYYISTNSIAQIKLNFLRMKKYVNDVDQILKQNNNRPSSIQFLLLSTITIGRNLVVAHKKDRPFIYNDLCTANMLSLGTGQPIVVCFLSFIAYICSREISIIS